MGFKSELRRDYTVPVGLVRELLCMASSITPYRPTRQKEPTLMPKKQNLTLACDCVSLCDELSENHFLVDSTGVQHIRKLILRVMPVRIMTERNHSGFCLSYVHNSSPNASSTRTGNNEIHFHLTSIELQPSITHAQKPSQLCRTPQPLSQAKPSRISKLDAGGSQGKQTCTSMAPW